MLKAHRTPAQIISIFFCLFLVWLMCGIPAAGQKVAKAPVQPPPGVPVRLQDKTLFEIHQGYFSFTPADRAKAIAAKILQLSKESKERIAAVRIYDEEATTAIVDGDVVIMTITSQDAAAAGKTRQALAQEYAGIIREAAESLRRQHSLRTIAIGALWGIIATVAFVLILRLLGVFFRRVYSTIRSWHGKYIRTIRIQRLELLPAERITTLLLVAARGIRVLFTFALAYAYVSFNFSLFPITRGYARLLLGYVLYPLRAVGQAIVAFVPNLFFIAVILLVAYYLTKVIRFFFTQLERQTISLSGFYPEWAQPTFKIVRLLVIAFTLVVIFPYLPGAKSPAFQGVSIFFGLLFSLGSTSAVANVVAGTVLTYTRAFQIGDRVKVGDTVGDVLGKNFLVTSIRTIKNEDISIPNSMVLGSHIVNFSSVAREQGLILHTSVTISYDAPWRTVHQLLLDAAAATPDVLREPKPFVLQTSLDDFYVRYELNVYTDKPSLMASMYSDLHQSIQDKFNESAVEILSPHYHGVRDGNHIAIPPEYVPKAYAPKSFRIDVQEAPAPRGDTGKSE
ncbi:MAG: mechanosensitive ion channel domain-containing protein [Candidatus Acidiferrum sp.]